MILDRICCVVSAPEHQRTVSHQGFTEWQAEVWGCKTKRPSRQLRAVRARIPCYCGLEVWLVADTVCSQGWWLTGVATHIDLYLVCKPDHFQNKCWCCTFLIFFFNLNKRTFFSTSTWMYLTLIELDLAQNQFGYTLEGFGLEYLLLSPWWRLDNLPAFCYKLHVQFICRKDLYKITFTIIHVLDLLGNNLTLITSSFL